MIKATFITLIFLASIVQAQDIESSDIKALIDEAIKNNTQLQAMHHEVEAAKLRVNEVRSWEAPEIGIEFYQTPIQSFPIPIKNGMETDYFVEQTVPWPGKLSAMSKVQVNNTGMMAEAYNALEKKIIRDLQNTYYELYAIQRKMEINTDNQSLMKEFIAIATRQYQVGMGRQSDVIRAQAELSRLINDGVNFRKENNIAEAMINTLLNRPIDQAFPHIADFEIKELSWKYEELAPLASANRAELKIMNYNIEMFKSELTVSKKESYPDFLLKGQYKNMANSSKDFWSLMIGVTIPFAPWSNGKYQSKVIQNEQHIMHMEHELSGMNNMVDFEVRSSLEKMDAAFYNMNLYKTTTIPQAQQSLNLLVSEYQLGKTEFLMMIDSYRMLLMAKLDYYMAVMQWKQAVSELEQAVGLNVGVIEEYLNTKEIKR